MFNKKILGWTEQIETLQKEGEGLSAKLQSGDFTEDEKTRAKAIVKEIADLRDKVETEQVALSLSVKSAKNVVEGDGEKKEFKKMAQKFSLVKGIKEFAKRGKLTGIENEMDAIARKTNPNISGIGVPHAEIKATLTSGVAATAGNAVATDLSGTVIEALTPNPLIARMGATFVPGLTSNLDMLRFTAEGDGAWEGETDANAEMNPTTDKLSWTPNRYGAFTAMSKTLQIQTDKIGDALLARNIRRSTERALDTQAFNGSGAPITGVLNLTNVGDVAGGLNGAVPTWANIVDLETQIRVDNVMAEGLGIVTTPQIVGLLKTVKKDTGSGIFVIENGEANGFPVYSSTLVPSTLDKGTSTGVCHAIILGHWPSLIVGQFGVYDVVIDPFTNAKNGYINVVVNSWWDMQFEHDEAFSAMQDALLS